MVNRSFFFYVRWLRKRVTYHTILTALLAWSSHSLPLRLLSPSPSPRNSVIPVHPYYTLQFSQCAYESNSIFLINAAFSTI